MLAKEIISLLYLRIPVSVCQYRGSKGVSYIKKNHKHKPDKNGTLRLGNPKNLTNLSHKVLFFLLFTIMVFTIHVPVSIYARNF